jgi:hypothetical protein
MEHPYDIGGGNSHIVDYQGNVLGHTSSGANTFVAGIIDIEALRQFRTMNLNSNWMKDLRTEIFQRMYSEPVHPKNLWLNEEPEQQASTRSTARTSVGSSAGGASRRRRTPPRGRGTSHPETIPRSPSGNMRAAFGSRTGKTPLRFGLCRPVTGGSLARHGYADPSAARTAIVPRCVNSARALVPGGMGTASVMPPVSTIQPGSSARPRSASMLAPSANACAG